MAIGVILILGVALRFMSWMQERCFWIDEAMLALNIENRSFAGLFQVLDHNQGAPVGFLLLTKILVSALGSAEWVYRLLPFVGSILTLGFVALIARRLLTPHGAVAAVLLCAVSPYAISYAGEFKQYSLDAGIATGLIWLMFTPLETRSLTQRDTAILAFAGAMAVWFSHPTVFVLTGVGLALIVMLPRSQWPRLAIVIVSWLTSFALLYLINLRHIGRNDYLIDFWREYFLPMRSVSDVKWLAERLVQFLGYPCGIAESRLILAPALLGVVVGVIALWRRPGILLAISGMSFAVLAASAMQKYPMGGRLMLFAVPMAILVIVLGFQSLANIVPSRMRLLMWCLPLALAGQGIAKQNEFRRTTPRVEELVKTLNEVQKQLQLGDRIYIYNGSSDAGAGPAFAYYRTRYLFPSEAVILGGVHREDVTRYRDEIAGISVSGRVWFVESHGHGNEVALIRSYFEQSFTRDVQIEHVGSSATLFRH